MLVEDYREFVKYFFNNCLPQFFFQNGGCIFTKHTSFMLKNTINNVIASVNAIIIVAVIIITSTGGGA